jgi:hypothetical protein
MKDNFKISNKELHIANRIFHNSLNKFGFFKSIELVLEDFLKTRSGYVEPLPKYRVDEWGNIL